MIETQWKYSIDLIQSRQRKNMYGAGEAVNPTDYDVQLLRFAGMPAKQLVSAGKNTSESWKSARLAFLQLSRESGNLTTSYTESGNITRVGV